MATGLPVVVTDVGGNPEIVVNGETGFIVPPRNPQMLAEALLKLLKDKKLRQQMGTAGRLRIEKHYSVDRKICETEKLYRELLCLANQ
jgi:glycosyltransferase involved in cell wall biosynthesis